nr:50S ribosomal protein L11 methyltransferase [candidate division Zixibacteria bacterium]
MTAGQTKPEYYFEVSITIPRDILDAVCNYIIENHANGLELEERNSGTETDIRFYVPSGSGKNYQKNLTNYINQIAPPLDFSTSLIRTRTIANISWEEEYRKSVGPIRVGPLEIRPPWYSRSADTRYDIIIEPKMAFGTGSHETTRLCLVELLKHVRKGQAVLDLGCGSGILAVTAARLGAARVKGLDIDRLAIDNALENIVINGVAGLVEIDHGSMELVKDDPPYDILVANIIKNTVVELYDQINTAVRPGGIIILSGLLIEDQDAILRLLPDYNNIARYELSRAGQWLAITVFKK